MAKDWRSGTLLGAQYAIVTEGKVLAVRPTREDLREMWRRSAKASGMDAQIPELPEKLLQQVCLILPPWESASSPEGKTR